MNLAESLQASVRSAYQRRQAINFLGAGTKSFLGQVADQAETLDVTGHSGIVEYDPAELVLVARAGTPLKEIVSVLAANRQMLGFEPPFVAAGATLGGAVASGLAGPRRAYSGSVRDFILGAVFINGQGERVEAGGKVIKNVAGFDLFRPMAGSMGTLGLLLEVALRVVPQPDVEATLEIEERDEASALKMMNRWVDLSQNISASCWDGSLVRVRLSGSEQGVEHACTQIGGARVAQNAYWDKLTDFELDFFKQKGRLWRVSLAPMTRPVGTHLRQIIDWGGAQRWLVSNATPEDVRKRAEKLGGFADCYSLEKGLPTYHPMPTNLLKINQKFKVALDPAGILNPHRLYSQL